MGARDERAISFLIFGICLLVVGCAGGDLSPASRDAGISGVLPNGIQYLVRSQPALNDTVDGVYGAIIIDLDDGEVPIEGPVVGIAGFYSDVELMQDLSFAEGVYVGVVSGDWYMHLAVYDHVVAELGETTESILLDSIVALDPPHESGLPVFELLPPLRWADDYEVPLHMEVAYRDFVVRRGCSELAVACSPGKAVEVVPGDRVASPHSAWPGNTVQITTR
ncbi:MAG: hypothetical protein OXN79_07445 [bacterium]|nr:hypothetical protein [bacterium]